MTQRTTTKITTCDRCAFGGEQPATTERKFTLDGDPYRLDLCEKHATMFDRDIGPWVLLAREDEYPTRVRVPAARNFFSTEVKERDARAAELRERELPALQPQPQTLLLQRRDTDPIRRLLPTQDWTLSAHAIERGEQRGFTKEDMLHAAVDPQVTTTSSERHGGGWLYRRGECSVIVDPDAKTVLTVLPKESSPDYDPHHRPRPRQERLTP